MPRHRLTSPHALAVLCTLLVVSCARHAAPPAAVTAAHDSTTVAHDSTTHDSTSSAAAQADTPRPAPLLAYTPRTGKVLYTKYCAVCHGDDGTGNGFNAYNLDPKPRDFTDSTAMNALSDEHLVEITGKGGRGVNRSVLMPSWEGRLTRREIAFVVAYLRTFTHRGG